MVRSSFADQKKSLLAALLIVLMTTATVAGNAQAQVSDEPIRTEDSSLEAFSMEGLELLDDAEIGDLRMSDSQSSEQGQSSGPAVLWSEDLEAGDDPQGAGISPDYRLGAARTLPGQAAGAGAPRPPPQLRGGFIINGKAYQIR